ncbi:MAG: hypothetical protein MUF02_09865 [Acidobacteria bacterium]|nr:hypothetical protein [Acidobacteriota bacterium]
MKDELVSASTFSLNFSASSECSLLISRRRAALHGVELQRGAAVVHRLDAGEELVVEVDVVVVGRQQGRQLVGHFLHRLAGGRVQQRVKNGADIAEQLPRHVEGDDGVLEGRRLGIGHDGVDLGLLPLHPLLHRRQVMGQLDAVEGRGVERGLVGAEEWIAFCGRKGQAQGCQQQGGNEALGNLSFIQG